MTDIRRLPEPLVDHWEWQLNAACRGMDIATFFHPHKDVGLALKRRIESAKTVCALCPVIEQCRDYALRVREPYGIWGDCQKKERARLLGIPSLRYPGKLAPTEPADADQNPASQSGTRDHHCQRDSRVDRSPRRNR